MKRLLLLTPLILFFCMLVHVDRLFFKRSHSFCSHFIYPSLSPELAWELPSPSEKEKDLLDEILKQKFRYLAKGCQCYAFLSEDQKYVIKFHRYPSSMRKFPRLSRPFSFFKRRDAIQAHNRQKLSENMQSYLACASQLKAETGLLFLHINPSENLQRSVTLIDATESEYQVPLDEVTFILQRKADLLYPTLDRYVLQGDLTKAKKTISHLLELLVTCCQKGYIDKDPVLYRNYGILEECAIRIDLGDIFEDAEISQREHYIPYIKAVTESLRIRLEKDYPSELLLHYCAEIEKL